MSANQTIQAGQPLRYSGMRMALHWAVAALIVLQWLTSGAIHRTHGSIMPPSPTDLLLHAIHNYSGMAIGLMIAARILLRLMRPVPPQAQNPPVLQRLSAAVHWGIYLSLAAQAGTGFITAYLWGAAGKVHVLLWNVTLALVAIHIAAALLHALRRDGTIWRMIPSFSAASNRQPSQTA